MPKRVRPYGSAADAESAALSRGRLRPGGEPVNELASTMMVREIASQAAEATRALSVLTSDGADFASLDDIRDVIASLERMGQDLPHLCEQLASPYLGTESNLRGVIDQLAVFRLLRIDAHRDRLVANLLDLVDAVSGSESLTSGIIADELLRHHCTAMLRRIFQSISAACRMM